jgi:hypothetical protein
MTPKLTIETQVHFSTQKRGRKRMQQGEGPKRPAVPLGRVPRIARLLALAIRFETLIREGQMRDQAELARSGHVSRARLTQIMNLTLLAPDIQEEVLFLPRTEHGRDPIKLALLQPIALELDWRRQREMWSERCAKPTGKSQ